MNEHDFNGDRPRQLLVCTFGEDCAAALKQRDGQAFALADRLKEARTAAGLKRDLYVTKTGCMGWCEHAPVVQLLPEGRIFAAPALKDAPAVVRACLDGGEALAKDLLWDYSLSRAQNQARQGGDGRGQA
ncbi:MAG TPA: (2Fe-2S) ferredoxin domain-containing protein [bacterium]|jgi:(2Fe-2S) ferredoxin|nr:(2Fe-2S) ferredoxin domain-containing protein [bacterium]HXC65472.1 (2Fe-2S) ferredoxin domain-containing protein [bacterium]